MSKSEKGKEESNVIKINVGFLKKDPIKIISIILNIALVFTLLYSVSYTKECPPATGMATLATVGAEPEESKPDVKVTLTVLNDEACKVCDSAQIVQSLQTIFENLKVKEVDYSSTKGKQLAESFGVEMIPAYIFDSAVTEASNYDQIARFLVKNEDGYLLRAQGNKYVGREEKPKTISLFVMSYCPFGIRAENNMKEVLDTFGDDINLDLHFISTDMGDGTFQSLHGEPETEENIRQLCAMKYYPDIYYEYILERNKDIRGEWKNAAEAVGLDVSKIEGCSTGEEGKELLRENIRLTEELGIGGSPTFLINNQIRFGGALSAEAIKQYYCGANPDLEGCNKKLSGESAPVTGSCG